MLNSHILMTNKASVSIRIYSAQKKGIYTSFVALVLLVLLSLTKIDHRGSSHIIS